MLVVYLTDKRLDVVVGSEGLPTEITRFISLTQLRGSVRDGVIVDPAGFRDVVEPFWKENNLPTDDVKIVLDTSHFMRKTVETPIFKKKTELDDYLRREILSLGRTTNPLFTYEITGAGKSENTQKVDLMIVESQLIERIVDVFGKFNVKISSVINNINSVIQALITMAQNAKMSGTVLLMAVTDNSAYSVLVKDGTYRYGSTQQLFNEYGSEGFSNEIARNVTNIQQFMMAQDISTDLDRVYLVGLANEAGKACIEVITDTSSIKDAKLLPLNIFGKVSTDVSEGQAPETINQLFPLIMALCAPEAGTGIIKTFIGEDEEKNIFSAIPTEIKPVLQALIPTGIALMVCLIAFVSVNIWNGTVQSQIDAANTILSTPEAKKQQLAYDAAKNSVDISTEEVNSSRTLINNLSQFPKPTTEVNEVVNNCASGLVTVEPVSYDSATGTYTISAKANDYSTIYQFVNKLMETGKYTVQYEGYTYNEATVRGGVSGVGLGTVQLDDGNWQLTVQLILPADTSER